MLLERGIQDNLDYRTAQGVLDELWADIQSEKEFKDLAALFFLVRVRGETMEKLDPSCPDCGSYDVEQTTEADDAGDAEFRCNLCGEYFVDRVREDV